MFKPNIHPEFVIAHGGESLGNPDPRFSDDISSVRAARLAVKDVLPELDDSFVIIPQCKTDFVDVDSPSPLMQTNEGLDEVSVACDAMITRRRRIGLMLNTADCVPIALADPSSGVSTVIHAGWYGAVHRLHSDVINYAASELGLKPETSVAFLGPSIQKKSYVTDKLHDRQQNDPDWQPYIDEEDDGFHVDIPGFVVSTLVSNGVKPDNIKVSPVDTGSSDSGFYSLTRHVRDGVPIGRNPFIITRA